MPGTIRIVLVETSHPGNIGAAARAMKTMCLERLVLVNPAEFPHADASARASGAVDVLERARVTATLDEALAGCALVAGTSARHRGIGPTVLAPRECATRLVTAAIEQDVALVFGRERIGLTNEELGRCHLLVNIPANPEYASLNLASAVQVLSYELMLARAAAPAAVESATPLATADEMERLYEHLEAAALETGFLDPANPKHLMRRLRRLFNRAQPDQNEVNILRGLLGALQGQKARRRNT
ncbi:MAG TPA: tRNA (cytosine(32)/uridine(32)-2'-O)-methyltransferase TrmJ [Gammaproteobacteria bacterium]|jgi:TrmH family RNA methyltransferase|nr:tRNA (cytosine(32)/uridine(32)-2'-O)-methyltransferase TrmJ [Gammaproteobacteria bacterium]